MKILSGYDFGFIPIRYKAGTREMASLAKIFEKAEAIEDFDSADPITRRALFVFLVSFTERILERSGHDFTVESLNSSFLEFRKQFPKAFDFGPDGRTLECRDSKVESKPAAPPGKLRPLTPSGNNGDHFEKCDSTIELRYRGGPVDLFLGHFFGLGGLGGDYEGKKTNFFDCETSRALSAFFIAENLATTLVINAGLLYQRLSRLNREVGGLEVLPPFECDDHGQSYFDQDVILEEGHHPFARMFYQRRIHCDWENGGIVGVRLGQGLARNNFSIDEAIPFLISRSSKKGEIIALQADKRRAVYREIIPTLRHLGRYRDLMRDFNSTLREVLDFCALEITGLITDQAKIEGVVHSVFKAPWTGFLGDESDGFARLEAAMDKIEKSAAALEMALKSSTERLFSVDDRKDKERIRQFWEGSSSLQEYWACIGQFIHEILQRAAASDEDSFESTMKMYRKKAIDRAVERFIKELPAKPGRIKEEAIVRELFNV